MKVPVSSLRFVPDLFLFLYQSHPFSDPVLTMFANPTETMGVPILWTVLTGNNKGGNFIIRQGTLSRLVWSEDVSGLTGPRRNVPVRWTQLSVEID